MSPDQLLNFQIRRRSLRLLKQSQQLAKGCNHPSNKVHNTTIPRTWKKRDQKRLWICYIYWKPRVAQSARQAKTKHGLGHVRNANYTHQHNNVKVTIFRAELIQAPSTHPYRLISTVCMREVFRGSEIAAAAAAVPSVGLHEVKFASNLCSIRGGTAEQVTYPTVREFGYCFKLSSIICQRSRDLVLYDLLRSTKLAFSSSGQASLEPDHAIRPIPKLSLPLLFILGLDALLACPSIRSIRGIDFSQLEQYQCIGKQ